MKRCMRTALCAVLAALCLTTAVLAADSTVTYTKKGGTIEFAPGSEYSATDLFDGFKGVMPGDSLTEQIVVKNKANNTVYVRIYMRALGAVEGSEELLNQMTLTVTQVGVPYKLFEAPADQKAQLTQWTHLGTFKSGGKATLDVTLDVPITMGNEFQDAVGALEWEFRVEEMPNPNAPSTGDGTPLALYGALMCASALAVSLLLILGRRRKKAEE